MGSRTPVFHDLQLERQKRRRQLRAYRRIVVELAIVVSLGLGLLWGATSEQDVNIGKRLADAVATIKTTILSPRLFKTGECNIKGNISVYTGERIYHVPDQRYYSETVISPSKGERWFCSEAEAWIAGWRKSKL